METTNKNVNNSYANSNLPQITMILYSLDIFTDKVLTISDVGNYSGTTISLIATFFMATEETSWQRYCAIKYVAQVAQVAETQIDKWK